MATPRSLSIGHKQSMRKHFLCRTQDTKDNSMNMASPH